LEYTSFWLRWEKYFFPRWNIRADKMREGTLGRHKPPQCRHAQMSMRNTSKCVCEIQEIFKNLCFKFKYKIFLRIFHQSGMRSFSNYLSIIINSAQLWLIKLYIKLYTFFAWKGQYLEKMFVLHFISSLTTPFI